MTVSDLRAALARVPHLSLSPLPTPIERLDRFADVLIMAGGMQSNHARATAPVAAKLGMKAVLVADGARPAKLTANALLDDLLGAEVVHVLLVRGTRAGNEPARLQEER